MHTTTTRWDAENCSKYSNLSEKLKVESAEKRWLRRFEKAFGARSKRTFRYWSQNDQTKKELKKVLTRWKILVEWLTYRREARNESWVAWVGKRWKWRTWSRIFKNLWRTTCVDFCWFWWTNYHRTGKNFSEVHFEWFSLSDEPRLTTLSRYSDWCP